MRKTWLAALAVVLAVPLTGIGTYKFLLSPVSKHGKTQLVAIKPGTGVIGICEQLEREHLVRSGLMLSIWLRLHDDDRSLKAGAYALSPAMSAPAIAEAMIEGKAQGDRLTVPEGFSMHQIADLLDHQSPGSGKRFLNLASRASAYASEFPFLAGLPANATLEGFLFPDTYVLTPDAQREQSLIRMMLTRFQQLAVPVYDQSSHHALGLLQTITLASIVEKEAAHAEERPLIAGVFFNRLAAHMPFGSDPTVEYALHRHEDARGLSLRDVAVNSPYNTYKHVGLPPGPIANPGLASIEAVLQPARTPYMYFVARGDGTHAFTRDYKDHLAAQRQILLSQRAGR
ncbi:MAG TPA: endolytic transglycosylase MltG [Oscillatoriaceae cyanobacterium]